MTFAAKTNQAQQPFLTQEQKDAMIQRNADTNAMIKLGLWKKTQPQNPTVILDRTQPDTSPIVNQQVAPVVDNTPPPIVPTNQQAIKSMGSSSSTTTSSTNYDNGAVNPFGVNPPQQPQYQFNNDDVLEKLFAEKPMGKPVLNEADQKRLKARGWLDALGRVAINVGDSMTLGMGGSPVKRGDSTTDQWFDRYFKNQSDHQKAVEDWQKADYIRRLQAGNMLSNQKDQDRNFKANRSDSNTQNWKWGEEQKANQDYRKEVLKQNEAQHKAQTKQQGDASARWWAEFNQKYPKEVVFNYDTSQGSQKLVIPRAEYPAKLKELYNKATTDNELSQYAPQLFEQVKVGTEKKADPETGLSSEVPVYSTQLTKEALSNPEIIIQAWLSKGGKAITPKWQNEGKQTPEPVNIINTPGLEPQYITPGDEQQNNDPLNLGF
jgi:hypothetical protein